MILTGDVAGVVGRCASSVGDGGASEGTVTMDGGPTGALPSLAVTPGRGSFGVGCSVTFAGVILIWGRISEDGSTGRSVTERLGDGA